MHLINLLSNPSYQIFSFPELSDNQCNQVLENFIKFLQQKERQGMIVFTGGEVFFRKDIFFRLIEKAQEEGIEWSVLGNPDLLTPRIMDELVANGIHSYQLSLDGMEQTHDHIRGHGEFKRCLLAVCLLKKADIPVNIQFTVSNKNKAELGSLMRLVAKLGVDGFGFDREILPTIDPKTTNLNSNDFRELCTLYLKERNLLKAQGFPTRFFLKSNLFSLLCRYNP